MTSHRATARVCMTPEIAANVLPPELRRRLASAVALAPDIAPGLLTERADDGALAPEALQALADVHVLVTGWGCPPLDEAVVAAAPRLRAVVHAAGSVRHHITRSVWDRGIVVSSAADANAGPVADFTCAAIVLAGKQALAAAASYGAGPRPFGIRQGCDGRTVGVIGASRIGKRVIDRLTSSSAGYRVLLTDPYVTPRAAAALGAELVEPDELCRRSSIVTLHAPQLPETRNLLDARRLALVPDGGTVVNTARGSLVDTEALTAECVSGRLNAFLDVTEPEPLPAGHPLLALRNVLVTPHIAGCQGSEVTRLGAYAVEEVLRLVAGKPPHGEVRSRDMGRIA